MWAFTITETKLHVGFYDYIVYLLLNYVVRQLWLTSDESEPQQMCLDICFVGLNDFHILHGLNWCQGESATSHHATFGCIGGQ
jgi:hypothetical protein